MTCTFSRIFCLGLSLLLGLSCHPTKTLPVIGSAESLAEPREESTRDSSKVFRDSLVSALLEPFGENTQIAVGVVNDGAVDHFGYVKKDGACKETDNRHMLFEIGSVTKVFTGIVLASTIIEGKIELSDSLAQLLPYAFEKGGSISVQHLTTHTSGIYSFPLQFGIDSAYHAENPYEHITEDRVRSYFENQVILEAEAGVKFSYSNLGVGMLGYILSKRQAKSLWQCYQNVILEPLKMSETCLGYENCSASIVPGLTKDGDRADHWTFHAIYEGAGGLLSNTVDMTRFIQAVTRGDHDAFEKSKTPLFRMNESTQICMNWFYSDFEDEGRWYWHGGGTGGYTSALFINDESDQGIIVLSNVSAFHPESANIERLAIDYLRGPE